MGGLCRLDGNDKPARVIGFTALARACALDDGSSSCFSARMPGCGTKAAVAQGRRAKKHKPMNQEIA